MADLALTVGLKGRDELTRPLGRAAKAAHGLRGGLREAGDGLDRAARGARGLGRGARAMAAPMGEAARRVRELERTSRNIDEFRRLKTAAKANSEALAEARRKTQALGRAMATGEGKTKKTAAAFKKARKSLAALEAKTEASARALRDLRDKLKAAGVSTRDLAAAQRGLTRDLERAERLARMKDRLRGLAGTLAKAAGAARGLAGRAAGILGPLSAIGGIASAAGLGRLVIGFATASDEIAKFARQTGFTADAIQELQYAAERQGVSQSTFNASIGAFSKRLGELRAGKGALAGLLKDADPALGAALATAASAEEAFGVMMTALQRIEDPQRRAALAAAAFSHSGMVMTRMAEAGADGLAALRAEARDLGAVVSNDTAASAEGFVDTMTRFETAVGGLGKAIAARLMPVLGPVVDSLTRWIVAHRDLIAARVEAIISRISDAVAAVDFAALGDGLARIGSAVGTAVEAFGGWETVLIGAAVVLNGGLIASVLSLGGGLLRFATSILPVVIGGLKLLAGVLIANPIGAIVAGIAGAAALIYANWEPISAWFADLWERVREPLADAWAWIGDTLGWTPLGLIVRHWEPISAWFADLWERVTAPFAAMIAFFEDKLAAVSGIAETVSGVFGGLFGTAGPDAASRDGDRPGLFGSLFGGGDDDGDGDDGGSPPAPGRRAPFPAPVASRPAAPAGGPVPAAAGAGGRVVHHQTIAINVTPPPGVDPREVARLVVQALEQAGRTAGDSGRGRLFDAED